MAGVPVCMECGRRSKAIFWEVITIINIHTYHTLYYYLPALGMF